MYNVVLRAEAFAREEDTVLHADYQVTIARPVAEVFEFFADGEKNRQWRTGVIEIRKVSGDGLGAQYKQTIRGPGGRTTAADYIVTEYSPNAAIAFAVTAGPVRPTGRFYFSDENEKTTVQFTLDAELAGIKKLLMGGMVTRTMTSEVRSLDKAKAILEG